MYLAQLGPSRPHPAINDIIYLYLEKNTLKCGHSKI